MPHTWQDNPLRTRDDLADAVTALARPVAARLSDGRARARLGATGAHFPDAAAELEGFARPLWGLAPLAAGGGDFDPEPYLRGLDAGTDPGHPEYWGPIGDHSQRCVEAAAIGFALALAPERFWEPLPGPAKDRLARWLAGINHARLHDNNWLFFRVLVGLGLRAVGAEGRDREAERAALDRLETFATGDGWYTDGPTDRADYYTPWAMHLYGLVYARLSGDDDADRARRLRERAAAFAADFAHWFADDGAAIPYGRSLIYRFAQAGFWGALAFADVEALPWGQVKGLLLRHLRHWARLPAVDEAGLLTIGYAYPDLNLTEAYNSPGSPYWAMKAFLPLALPGGHPFWRAEETGPPRLEPVRPQPHAGMVLVRDRTHAWALAGGQSGLQFRHGAEKYAKFAYSTAFGFSVPAGGHGLHQLAADSMLALSEDGTHWRVRESAEEVRVEGGTVRSRWRPWPDVEIETTLTAGGPWHVRTHLVRTGRPLWTAEGGWALDRTGDDPADPRGREESGPGFAQAAYPAGFSGLRDLDRARTGELVRAEPNTNLLHPRTVIPTLRGRCEPGEHRLSCEVLAAGPGPWERLWKQGSGPSGQAPQPPTIDGEAASSASSRGSAEPSAATAHTPPSEP
ncbi:DUF2264 domain-containing protein [Glycomyces salinus]|uniref:DUF2264 domain-containing protein n=1 Tax=Glycomyces salinus TaxID=980294 RepID=UPI0018EA46CF|nr:DUF2264 domain-containing protein [Glycomyces salinus]